jgi:choline kinase
MIEHAILLSAGQGSRMLPLTAERPKCLIDFSGRSLLEWQVEMLARGGVKHIDVVTGFMTDMVDEVVARIDDPRVTITTRFNPFFKVADNLGSCWIVREQMRGDFLILNGDTLVSEQLVRTVQPAYDSDDMKVERADEGRGDKLVHIGKTLTAQQSNAESIGFLAFRGEGVELFRETVRKAMRTPEGVQHWYLKVIDSIAPTDKVGTVSIEGQEWAEVDFLNDIEIATALTDRWAAA